MIKPEHKSFLFELLTTPSPVGGEMPGQRVWARYLRPVSDTVENDAYGNTWATLKARSVPACTVMLEAHADEIGFMINYISDEGFVSVIANGGSDVAIARGKRVVFFGTRGPVRGIIGNTAIHLRRDSTGDEKAPKWHELFIDVGAGSRIEVHAKGLQVGVCGVYDIEPMELSDQRLVSRAIDNRISGYILARVFEELHAGTERPEVTVYAVNAVQEEVGGNGAMMITDRLMPDVAICFDVTHATDTPGIDRKKVGDVKLGAGPSLTYGTANHPLVVERLTRVATEAAIPVQHEATSRYTGTDTDKIFKTRSGIPSALISIPLRYMHSPVETVDLTDVENTVKLTVAFIRSLHSDERFTLRL
jgi:putative aminopeptidase FrvX